MKVPQKEKFLKHGTFWMSNTSKVTNREKKDAKNCTKYRKDNVIMKNIGFKKCTKAILTAVLAALTLTSCGNKNAMDMKGETNAAIYDDFIMEPTEYSTIERQSLKDGGMTGFVSSSQNTYYEAEESVSESDVAASNDVVTRKIIYSSVYDIDTKTFDASLKTVEQLCGKYGAYMEKSNVYASDGFARRAYYTIRVPVDSYKAFTSEAGSIGVVTSSSQDNKDVTENYYDTEARLESAKIREERVLEILKNSAMLDDVLALERELADIRYEIESYTGTLRKYDSLISYATVNININEVKEYVEPKTEVVSFGERMSSSFNEGINEFKEDLQDILVDVSYNFIPLIIWLIVLTALVLIARIVIKKIRRKFNEADIKEYASVEKHTSEKAENSEEKESK